MKKNIFVFIVYVPIFLLITATNNAHIITIIDETQFNTEILQGTKHALVEFAADWCSVCKGIQKPLQEIADESEFADVTFAQVNIDSLKNLSKENGIVGVPTFVYLENGKKKSEEIGIRNLTKFKDHLRNNIRKTFQVAQNNQAVSEIAPDIANQQPRQPVSIPTPREPEKQYWFMEIINQIKRFIIYIFVAIQEVIKSFVNLIKRFFGW